MASEALLKGKFRYILLGLLAIVFPCITIASLVVAFLVASTFDLQERVRLAQSTSALILRLQLDEEAALRGYTSTGHPVFLQPFGVAQRQFPQAEAALEQSLNRLDLGPQRKRVEEIKRLRLEWIERVVDPLLANRKARNAIPLQLRGKAIVDAMRTQSFALQQELNLRASQATQRAKLAAQSLLVVSGIVLGIFAIVAYLYHRIQSVLVRALQAEHDDRVYADAVAETRRHTLETIAHIFTRRPLPVVPHLRFNAVYLPAQAETQLGGDWYDAMVLPGGRILFAVGDVVGHGVEAALAMTTARQAIISEALHEREPCRILERVNTALRLHNNTLASAICGFIDPENMEIVYATAGHPPPIYVLPNGEASTLPYFGVPLGCEDVHQSKEFVAKIVDGAMLVLYTDGVTEIEHNVIAGERNLLAAASASLLARTDDPAKAIIDDVLSGRRRRDDVAVLTVVFDLSGMDALHRRLREEAPQLPYPPAFAIASRS